MMEYKNYVGFVFFDDEANVFHGEVINTRDVITFQGQSVQEVRQAFQESVDEYLAWCEERQKTPDRPFSGKFVVRIDKGVHRALAAEAAQAGISLNALVAQKLSLSVNNSIKYTY